MSKQELYDKHFRSMEVKPGHQDITDAVVSVDADQHKDIAQSQI